MNIYYRDCTWQISFSPETCISGQIEKFTCKTGQCVEKRYLCDGEKNTFDCSDGSDENEFFCGKLIIPQLKLGEDNSNNWDLLNLNGVTGEESVAKIAKKWGDVIYWVGHMFFPGLMNQNEKCKKCSLLGTNTCDTSSGDCICQDGYYGETCERKLLYQNLKILIQHFGCSYSILVSKFLI